MAIAGWLIREKGVRVPAFAGMTGVAGGDGLVAPGLRGWWVSETRVWVPAFAGMTEGAGVECGWGAGYGCVWKWGVFVAIADLRVVEIPSPSVIPAKAGTQDPVSITHQPAIARKRPDSPLIRGQHSTAVPPKDPALDQSRIDIQGFILQNRTITINNRTESYGVREEESL